MTILYQTFHSSCPLEARETLARIEHLLSQEGVEHISSGLLVASTSTPFVILGFQPKLYTRKNRVGLNPFAFVTGVKIQCESDGALTRITVRINRRRSVLHVVFWGACGALMATAMPAPAGVVLLGAIVIVAWFTIVKYLGGRLVNSEILSEVGGSNDKPASPAGY
jgi:hypothetical protein